MNEPRRYPRALGGGRGDPMHASIRLARVQGIEIGINWTWLLVLALFVSSLATTVFPTTNPHLGGGVYVAMATVAAVLFFASLVLHELGHAIVAKREGMEIAGITLWVFGGVARFKSMFPSAGAELRIAIAGPLVSLVIGLACVGAASLTRLPAAIDGVLSWLGQINLILLAFNMLPALPLDGGRVLRSILWGVRRDFASATRAAGVVSELLGRFMIGAGLAMTLLLGAVGGLWLAFIGWFVLVAARAETGFGILYQQLSGLRVGDVMSAPPVSVPDWMPLPRFEREVFLHTRYASYPVTHDGDVVGVIAEGDVAATPEALRPRRTVRDRMLPIDRATVFTPDGPLSQATAELLQTELQRGLVLEDGRLVGVLSITDVRRTAGGMRDDADALTDRAAAT